MPAYFALFSCDYRDNVWVYGYDGKTREDDGHHLFPAYAQYRCPNCGRLDEDRLLPNLTEPLRRLPRGRDFFHADDGPVIVSTRFVDAIREADVRGLRFSPLPQCDDFFLCAATVVAPTRFEDSGVRAWPAEGYPAYARSGTKASTPDHRCPTCGRYFELAPWPRVASMSVPEDPMTVFRSDVWVDRQQHRLRTLFATDAVRAALARFKLRGLVFTEAP